MKLFFYLLILLLPTQLGRHFWPNFSFIQGIRVDYLSLTLYITDILIALLFLTWIVVEFKMQNLKLRISKRFVYLTLVFIGLIASGIYWSASPFASLYGLTKLFEFSFLAFYVAKTVTDLKQVGQIVLLLALGVIFESFLGIWQFVNQSSVGGFFWFLGERTFNGQTLGIAQAAVNGQLILRPYATFSHPNVLAGFLVVAMTLIISNLKSLPRRQAGQISNLQKLIFPIGLIIGTVALILTISRVAIILWFLIILGWISTNPQFKTKLAAILVFLLAIVTLYFSGLSPRLTNLSLTDESFSRRSELTTAALEMTKSSPLVGVGLNNFLINLPNFQQARSIILYLQPVHNIYLLIAAEIGIIGLGFFLWFIGKTYQKLKTQHSKLKRPLFIALTAILILGLFDHYFLTLQQGQLLFTLILGLCWAKIKG